MEKIKEEILPDGRKVNYWKRSLKEKEQMNTRREEMDKRYQTYKKRQQNRHLRPSVES